MKTFNQKFTSGFADEIASSAEKSMLAQLNQEDSLSILDDIGHKADKVGGPRSDIVIRKWFKNLSLAEKSVVLTTIDKEIV